MINNYLRWFFLLLILCITASCSRNEAPKNLTGQNKTANVYRFYLEQRQGFKIWIVDGASVRRDIFNEFLYGGNPQRYTFIPNDEIWIDNSISAEEYKTTLAHELNERRLMAELSMTYFDAHDSSLQLEEKMRKDYSAYCRKHEAALPPVLPIDFDSTQEIESLPQKIKLKNIYRVPHDERNGIKIWIVDGFEVRRDIYPDFGLSGNDLAYHFIPKNEIWIDGDVSCEETEYSIAAEMKERELMAKNYSYDDAYIEAVKISDNMRREQQKLSSQHKELIISNPLFRDKGTGK